MKTTIFRWLTIILEFLNLPWEDAVMHHEEQINKPGGVSFGIISVQFSLMSTDRIAHMYITLI